MEKLATVAVEDLQAALKAASSGKAVKRLVIALAYKDGVSVKPFGKRYDIPRFPIYYWLGRFGEAPIEEAISNEDRPSRPSKLTTKSVVNFSPTYGSLPKYLVLSLRRSLPNLFAITSQKCTVWSIRTATSAGFATYRYWAPYLTGPGSSDS